MVMWYTKGPVKVNLRFTSEDSSAVGRFENSIIGLANTSIIRHFDSRSGDDSNFSFDLDHEYTGVFSVTSIVHAATRNGKEYSLLGKLESNGKDVLELYDDNGELIDISRSDGWYPLRSNIRSGARKFANWGINIKN